MRLFKKGDLVRIKPNKLEEYNPDKIDSDWRGTVTVDQTYEGESTEVNCTYKDGTTSPAALFRPSYLELVTPVVTALPKPLKLPKVVTGNTIIGQATASRQLKIAAKQNIAALLIGDTGTGKTTIVKDIAEQAKAEYIRFNLTGDTTVEEFVGKYTLEGGATKWADGVLLTAMKKGQWLIVDEVNVALPEILFVLHSLLDDERAVLVANHNGEIVKPHKDFRFFATMNPVDEYAGTKDLNKAFKSRFGMILNLEYPSPRQEQAILVSKGGIEQGLAAKLVDLAVAIRKAKDKAEVFYTCSTRDLLQVAELSKHLPIDQAITLTIVNKANGDGKAIKRIVKDLFAEYQAIEKITGTTNIDLIDAKTKEFMAAAEALATKEQQFADREKELKNSLLELQKKEQNLTKELTAKMVDQKAELERRVRRQLLSELSNAKA